MGTLDVIPNIVATKMVPVPFDPTDIAGLIAWFDFSDGGANGSLYTDTGRTTHAVNDADVIKGVTDKSASGFHLSEATNGPAYRTGIKNGKSVGRWDGVNDTLSHTSRPLADASFTVFIVSSKRSAPDASARSLLASGGQAQFTAGTPFDATKYVWYQNQAGSWTSIATAAGWQIWVLRVNSAASMDIYAGGGTATNLNPDDTVTTNAAMFWGNNNSANTPADVDIAEVYWYDTAFSPANVNLAGAWLGSKWGVTWTTAV